MHSACEHREHRMVAVRTQLGRAPSVSWAADDFGEHTGVPNLVPSDMSHGKRWVNARTVYTEWQSSYSPAPAHVSRTGRLVIGCRARRIVILW
jgi:hypothetical protein